MNDTITIADLEVSTRVGVPDEERATPQRLLISLEMEQNFSEAAATDSIGDTIDYYAVTVALVGMAKDGEWHLIEKLAEDAAALVLDKFQPDCVRVEVKKFILSEARHVAVCIERRR